MLYPIHPTPSLMLWIRPEYGGVSLFGRTQSVSDGVLHQSRNQLVDFFLLAT